MMLCAGMEHQGDKFRKHELGQTMMRCQNDDGVELGICVFRV